MANPGLPEPAPGGDILPDPTPRPYPGDRPLGPDEPSAPSEEPVVEEPPQPGTVPEEMPGDPSGPGILT